MNQKESIKKLWAETFADSREYIDMYFDRVYRDEDAMTVTTGGKLESSLLLQRYGMLFQNAEVPIGYVAGAMTRRASRGKGLMSALMRDAIRVCHERGDMLITLIPAHDWLYFFYDRFGFSTVFFVDPQRFTALHTFAPEGTYHQVDDLYDDKVFDAFSRFERGRKCSVLHSRRDFLNIIDDNRMDGGKFVVMADESGEIVSMAWAVVGDVVTVTELMGTSHDSREGALAALRSMLPDKAFKVLAPPLAEYRHLYDRGMARIVNARLCLEKIAANNPQWHSRIRVTDPLIADNCHIYEVADGSVSTADDTSRRPDFDVKIEVLNDIVFSSPKTGEILDFPSERPVMSLMLE